MDHNEFRVVDVIESHKKQPKKQKQKLVWDNPTVLIFLELCLEELANGNRPSTHFNKDGWSNLETGMKKRTGKVYNAKQLKNKWVGLKRIYKIYDRLTRRETGIGGTRSLLDAPDEWWDEKIKEDKDVEKFRDTDLSLYETHYAPLFRDIVAVGDQTMNPLQFQNISNPNDVQVEENVEGKGDSDEMDLGDGDPLFPSFPAASYTKRKKGKDTGNNRSTKTTKTSTFEDKLDVVLEALSTKSTQAYPPHNPCPTIADCMKIVVTFPGFNEGSKPYTQALRVLVKKQHREAFMFPTTNEAKMDFLNLVMED